MRTFDALAEPEQHYTEWLEQLAQADAFARSMKRDAIADSIWRYLETKFTESASFPTFHEMHDLLKEQLGEPSLSNVRTPGHPSFDDVARVILNDALVKFLVEAEPSPERLSAVVSLEHYVTLHRLAAGVANSSASEAWAKSLDSLRFSLTSINGDEHMASDAMETWLKEVPKPVPHWREEVVPRGAEPTIMAAEIQRAIDPDRWLQLLDRSPHPVFLETLLWEAHPERNPAVILEWIRKAPLAFDEDGNRTASVVVYALERKALSILEQDLMRRTRWGSEKDNAREMLKTEVSLREALADALLSRGDGKPLVTELAAAYLDRAQAHTAESTTTQVRHELYYCLGSTFSRRLGGPDDVLELAKKRSDKFPGRSVWGLWLLAPVRCEEDRVEGLERPETMLASWHWLRLLLETKDAGICDRYAPFAQWTEHLAGLALAACENPEKVLAETWHALTIQRLERTESRYERKDTWKASRFLIRAGFFAAHIEQVRERHNGAVALWTTSHRMALTTWSHLPDMEAFSDVAHGLAHLAKAKIAVPLEPATTFSYLIGEVDEVADAVVALLGNGADAQRLLVDAQKVGIDLETYLALVREGPKASAISEAREALIKSRPTDAT